MQSGSSRNHPRPPITFSFTAHKAATSPRPHHCRWGFLFGAHMIDYSTMKVGDTADLPHKSVWEGSNQDEYVRAQAYAASMVSEGELYPQFEVSQNMLPGGEKPIPIDQPGCGFTIKRVR